jgi:transposase
MTCLAGQSLCGLGSHTLTLSSDVICDELWAVIEPVLPCSAWRLGRPWNDHRMTLEAIAWRFRTAVADDALLG